MPIQRLTSNALQKIIGGKVRDTATCVIKFYSNTCELCHNFHNEYEELSFDQNYQDIHFFAFNLADHPTVDFELGFEGVPTVVLVALNDKASPQIEVCPDPPDPHPLTFLRKKDVSRFIDQYRDRKPPTVDGRF